MLRAISANVKVIDMVRVRGLTVGVQLHLGVRVRELAVWEPKFRVRVMDFRACVRVRGKG